MNQISKAVDIPVRYVELGNLLINLLDSLWGIDGKKIESIGLNEEHEIVPLVKRVRSLSPAERGVYTALFGEFCSFRVDLPKALEMLNRILNSPSPEELARFGASVETVQLFHPISKRHNRDVRDLFAHRRNMRAIQQEKTHHFRRPKHLSRERKIAILARFDKMSGEGMHLTYILERLMEDNADLICDEIVKFLQMNNKLEDMIRK